MIMEKNSMGRQQRMDDPVGKRIMRNEGKINPYRFLRSRRSPKVGVIDLIFMPESSLHR